MLQIKHWNIINLTPLWFPFSPLSSLSPSHSLSNSYSCDTVNSLAYRSLLSLIHSHPVTESLAWKNQNSKSDFISSFSSGSNPIPLTYSSGCSTCSVPANLSCWSTLHKLSSSSPTPNTQGSPFAGKTDSRCFWFPSNQDWDEWGKWRKSLKCSWWLEFDSTDSCWCKWRPVWCMRLVRLRPEFWEAINWGATTITFGGQRPWLRTWLKGLLLGQICWRKLRYRLRLDGLRCCLTFSCN